MQLDLNGLPLLLSLNGKLDGVAILVRMTLLAEIELVHFSILSSRDLNYHNDIQLFLQQFEKFNVNCVTN